MENSEMSPATPAHATEAPSIGKVWRQLKSNCPTFAMLWGIIALFLIASLLIDQFLALKLYTYLGPIQIWVDVPTTILACLANILMISVPAIYYTTDHCPAPGEIFSIIYRKPRRYVLAGFLFTIVTIIGLLLCLIPGILVVLSTPLYVHYVFATDLSLTTCLSKTVKATFQNFGGLFLVSSYSGLAIVISVILCIFPVLAVWPMTQLYLQNYIHYKGIAIARTTRGTTRGEILSG